MPALYIVIGVTLAALIVLTILYFVMRKREKAAESGEAPRLGDDTASVLVHEAGRKLSAAKMERGARVSGLPVYILLGEPGSTKTSVMLHSGLDPELISGQVYQGGNVTPTRSANFWFSRGSVFVELGGQLLSDVRKWKAAVRKLKPRSSVFGKGGQAPRAAVVCFDCENFTKPGAADLMTNAARNLRARLGEISQAMGISLPVYALFTRMDRLPYFAEYVRNLNNEEANQVVGVTLPMIDRRTEGVYAEEETARLTGCFDRLFRSAADARIEFLPRETDGSKLPAAYEFPREFRKIRPYLVQFLVDLCRPSQLTVGPFLRGFYFTGVRPVIVNERSPLAAAPRQAPYGVSASGATGIFSAPETYAPQAAPPPVIGARKVPQWLFLSHLFNDVLLADQAAMGASGSSVRTSAARRFLFLAAAAVCFLLSLAFTVSFFHNRALEARVHDAAVGIASTESAGADLASLDSLRKLETLRQSLETLVTYHREGPPWSYRWFLYVGDDLYLAARRIYFDRFRQLLLAPTQNAILGDMRFLPASPVPEHPYQPTYDELKAYLITTSHHEKSTRLFLTPALMRSWTLRRDVDPDRRQLARQQFDFYAEELREENPFASGNDTLAVERSRAYLKQFAGAERVYAYMLAEADKAGAPVNFNRQFPGSSAFVVDNYDMRGAFSKGGWNFMRNNFGRADQFFSGEPWVLGEQGAAITGGAILADGLKSRYNADFIKEWTACLQAAAVVRYAGLKDAAQKLKQHSSNQAPLLELFSLASRNTAVDDPILSAVFQPVQSVTPPENTDKYVAPSNGNYINALMQLQASIELVADQPQNDLAAGQTLLLAKQAEGAVGQLAQAFRVDSPVQGAVQKLLTDPITFAEALLKNVGPSELNAKGRALCAQIHPVLAKYPFAPLSPVQATLPDIDSVFKPREGALWQFVEANLQKYITRQGSQYVANPSGGVTINGSFLSWLNRAAAFSDAAFKDGSPDPHFTYTIRPELSADMEKVTLVIDGQTPARPFVWPGSAHGVQMNVTFQGGKDFTYPSYDGLWAVFQWVADADSKVGPVMAMTLRSGRQGRPVLNPATQQPVTVRFDIGANPPIFDRGYFTLTCVADIAR